MDDVAPDEAALEEAKNDPEEALEGMATTVDTPSATEDAGGADAEPAGAEPEGTDTDADCD